MLSLQFQLKQKLVKSINLYLPNNKLKNKVFIARYSKPEITGAMLKSIEHVGVKPLINFFKVFY